MQPSCSHKNYPSPELRPDRSKEESASAPAATERPDQQNYAAPTTKSYHAYTPACRQTAHFHRSRHNKFPTIPRSRAHSTFAILLALHRHSPRCFIVTSQYLDPHFSRAPLSQPLAHEGLKPQRHDLPSEQCCNFHSNVM